MKKEKTNKLYFTPTELVIMLVSISLIILSFVIFKGEDYLTLITSVLGVICLLFCAKGNPIGQLMCIVFGCVYGYVSFGFGYYGETVTYACMTVPMAVLSLVSWLRNPHKGNRAEVEVNSISWREIPMMLLLAAGVTGVMFVALYYLGASNLIPSTVSVFTSFIAVYLTFRRSPFFALAYAANDIVLVVLWVLASLVDTSYISVATCFAVFFINDIYGFLSWRRMERRQATDRS